MGYRYQDTIRCKHITRWYSRNMKAERALTMIFLWLNTSVFCYSINMKSQTSALSLPPRRNTSYSTPYFPYLYFYICKHLYFSTKCHRKYSEYCGTGKNEDLGVSNAPNPPAESCRSLEYNLIVGWVYYSNTYHIKGVAREQLLECTRSYLSTKVSVSFWVNLKILALKSPKKNNPTNLNGILKKTQHK